MNDNAKKWVAALRSGDYHQTNGKLRRDDPDGSPSYCCLGVACELAVKAHVIGTYNPDALVLPGKAMRWLGLAGIDGAYNVALAPYSLVYDNDERRLSFEQIANVIESQPAGLFR